MKQYSKNLPFPAVNKKRVIENATPTYKVAEKMQNLSIPKTCVSPTMEVRETTEGRERQTNLLSSRMEVEIISDVEEHTTESSDSEPKRRALGNNPIYWCRTPGTNLLNLHTGTITLPLTRARSSSRKNMVSFTAFM